MTINKGSYRFEEFDQVEFDRLMRQGSATWKYERTFLVWAGMTAGQKAVDVGCGPGVITRLMADNVGESGHVVGIDISPDLLETAMKLKADNTTLILGSVYDLSEHREQYDFAYVRLLFQHLARPQEAIREIYSILKPGGRICVLDSDESVFTIQPEHPDLMNLVRETQELQRRNGGDRFVGAKLGYFMRSVGFEDVEPQIFVMTPEMMGRNTFLDVVLKFRPMLFPADRRDAAAARTQDLYRHAEEHMIYGHNGSFVVRGRKPNQ